MTNDDLANKISKESMCTRNILDQLVKDSIAAYNHANYIRSLLQKQPWYYSDEMNKTNKLLTPGIWYDRKVCGDPDVQSDDGQEFLILVRYFEVTPMSNDPKGYEFYARYAIDMGYMHKTNKYWEINNDWDECGLGIEVLAYSPIVDVSRFDITNNKICIKKEGTIDIFTQT